MLILYLLLGWRLFLFPGEDGAGAAAVCGDGWHVGNGAAVPCRHRPQLGAQRISILELGMQQRDLYFYLELYLHFKKTPTPFYNAKKVFTVPLKAARWFLLVWGQAERLLVLFQSNTLQG